MDFYCFLLELQHYHQSSELVSTLKIIFIGLLKQYFIQNILIYKNENFAKIVEKTWFKKKHFFLFLTKSMHNLYQSTGSYWKYQNTPTHTCPLYCFSVLWLSKRVLKFCRLCLCCELVAVYHHIFRSKLSLLIYIGRTLI